MAAATTGTGLVVVLALVPAGLPLDPHPQGHHMAVPRVVTSISGHVDAAGAGPEGTTLRFSAAALDRASHSMDTRTATVQATAKTEIKTKIKIKSPNAALARHRHICVPLTQTEIET